HERDLSHALDRLQSVADELRQEHHERRDRDWTLSERRENAEHRCRERHPDDRGADTERIDRARGEDRPDKGADPAGRDHDAQEEWVEVEVLEQVEGIEDAVERSEDVGEDRSQRERENDGVTPHGAETLDDLMRDPCRRIAFGSRRLGAADERERNRRHDERERVDEDREWRAGDLDERPREPWPADLSDRRA